MDNLRLLICNAKLDQILVFFAELCAIVLRKGDVLAHLPRLLAACHIPC
jgi:hypothetical protein